MSTPNVTKIDSSAIYHELSPKLVLLVRIVNVITLLMVIISIILCIVQGTKNGSYYLLICNLVISGLVCSVVNWWYRNGDLGSEKFWFIVLVGIVILIQCITTDLFVFKEGVPVTVTTTIAPITNSTQPVSWSSNISPSMRP